MLLKWLFTILAVLWLIQALRPYFNGSQGMNIKGPPQPPDDKDKHDDDDGEYIDYEEIK